MKDSQAKRKTTTQPMYCVMSLFQCICNHGEISKHVEYPIFTVDLYIFTYHFIEFDKEYQSLMNQESKHEEGKG